MRECVVTERNSPGCVRKKRQLYASRFTITYRATSEGATFYVDLKIESSEFGNCTGYESTQRAWLAYLGSHLFICRIICGDYHSRYAHDQRR